MKRRPNLPLWQFVALIFIVALTVSVTFAVYTKWWPWLMKNTNLALYETNMSINVGLFCDVRGNIERTYLTHSNQLLSFERDSTPFGAIDLTTLTNLPGVLDGFKVDFTTGMGYSVNHIIPDDSLDANLNPKNFDPRIRMGGAAQMMRRTIGGLTRLKRVKVGDRKYPVLLRYQGSYYPERTSQVVGMILDEEWFKRQVPVLLDSLAKEDMVILFWAPQPPDTQWLPVSDPYRAANNEWKLTMGVMDGKDTLWWYGDPQVNITLEGDDPGYVVPMEPFGYSLLVKSEFPIFKQETIAGKRTVKWLLPLIQIMIQAILIVLVLTVAAYRLQIKRNRIALAHLAHSVKTPVARLKLITETLSEERAASPEEERGLVAAVSRECGRLERAVQNAALSLERGKREFHLESGNLAAAVREVADAWKPSFEQAGIRLELDLAAEPLQASFDKEMFTVLLDNLLDNALRHTRLKMKEIPVGQAEVTVALHREKERMNLTVDDLGGGIPKSQQRRIFQRFGRGSRDAATGVSGLGLGLALVKEIAEGHNGKVRVENNDRGGARFVISLTS